MTAKEYADNFRFKKIEPNEYGHYSLPMEFIRSMLSMAFMDGKIDGMKDTYDKLTGKESVDGVSQSN